MNDSSAPRFKHPFMTFAILLLITILAAVFASLIQSDFGRVAVENVRFDTETGRSVRAKLLYPARTPSGDPMDSQAGSRLLPGVVYIHGYQNNRETSDPYAIELARRGFAVLEIDALGRGNSDNPGYLEDPDFDETFGGRAAITELKSLPMVDPGRVGVMGHSLGGEMAFTIAVTDPSISAVSFSGFGYRDPADTGIPRNMLMIFGKYDEYRKRMTGTRNFSTDFMSAPQTLKVFPAADHCVNDC